MIDITQLAPHDGDAPSKLREWSSFIGIITAIVGNILISFALNIQRYAHIRMERERERRSGENEYIRQGMERNYGTQQQRAIAEERAQLNLSSTIHHGLHSEHGSHLNGKGSSNGHDLPGQGALPRSRSSSSSTIRQSEKMQTRADTKTYLSSPYWWAGILLMVIGEAGNFLAYGFAPASIVSPLGVVALVSNCIIAPCLLKERFRQRDFWGVVVAVGGAVTVVFSANTSEKKMGQHEIWSAISRWEFELYLGITAALIIGLMWASGKYGDKSILIDLGLVGLFGGYTALSTKGVASLLSDTLWRTLTFPVTYLLVFILVATAFLQVRYVNRALQGFDSTQVIPTQFVLFTLSVIIGSAILYRDFESATAEQFGKFIGGCALTFLGVYLITSGRAGRDDGLEDNGDEEEGIGLVDEERYEVSDSDEECARWRSKSGVSPNGGQASQQSSRRQSGSPSRTPRSRTYSTSPDALTDTDEGVKTPLLRNPWRSSSEDVLNSSSVKPLKSGPSPSASSPHDQTSRRQSHQKLDRPPTISRKSLSRMLPGPLIAPLSSPLSAIVAESIRRGVDSPSSRRRPRLPGVLYKSRSVAGGEVEIASGSSPLKNLELEEEEEESGPSNRGREVDKKRSKSISGALGSFLGRRAEPENKSKKKNKGNDWDRE